jgi:hypothetical protein
MEYGIDLLQKVFRDLAGDPIAGVRAVVENFLQENSEIAVRECPAGAAESFADCQPA